MSDLVEKHDPIIRNLKDLKDKEKEKMDEGTITYENMLTRPVMVSAEASTDIQVKTESKETSIEANELGNDEISRYENCLTNLKNQSKSQ